jgi:hypothetical protein
MSPAEINDTQPILPVLQRSECNVRSRSETWPAAGTENPRELDNDH